MVFIWLLISTVIISVLIYYLFLATIIDDLLHAVPNEPPVAHSYIPVFGFASKFMKNPYDFVHWLHQKYGNRITAHFMSHRHIFLNDQTTFLNRIAKHPAFTFALADTLAHNGGGARWQCIQNEEAQHALIKQYHEFLFGQELLVLNHKTCEYLIKRLTEDELPSSSSSKTVNLFDYFGEIMFDTAVTVLYGETFTRSQSDLYASSRRFDTAISTMMLDIPFKSFFLRSAIRQRDQFIERFIHLSPNDDMSKLVLARIHLMESFDDGRVFNERDKAGFHALILWAAAANTVPFTCWSLVDLLLHPNALEAVKDELKTKVKSISSLYDKEILDELKILDSCIQESMRRSFPMILHRKAAENVTVTCMDGTQMGVRKNDVVIYPTFLQCFDPEIYDRPYEYHYDRFIKQQLKVTPLFVFGTGSRMCPGRYWVVNEMKLLLALVLTTMDIELMMDDDFKQKMRKQFDCQLSNLLINLGPKEKDKHQFRIRYSIKK